MKLHRFHIDFDPALSEVKISDAVIINQIINVLRLKEGDVVLLFNGKGAEVRAEIFSLNNKLIDLIIVNSEKNNSEAEMMVSLYCSILKKENFEFVVQKATEIGVSEIIPVLSARTVKLNLNNERLKKIIKEAAEQSGRLNLPSIRGVVSLGDAILDSAKKNNKTLLFDLKGKKMQDHNRINHKDDIHLGIFIGPEGGWSPEEINLAKSSDVNIVSLGKTTLRAETAAVIASYLAVSLK